MANTHTKHMFALLLLAALLAVFCLYPSAAATTKKNTTTATTVEKALIRTSGEFQYKIATGSISEAFKTQSEVQLFKCGSGNYKLVLNKTTDADDTARVRAVLLEGKVFLGTTVLGTPGELAGKDILRIDVGQAAVGLSTVTFTFLPDDTQCGAIELALSLDGFVELSEFSALSNAALSPVRAVAQTAVSTTQTIGEEQQNNGKRSGTPSVFIGLLVLLLLVAAAFVLTHLFRTRIEESVRKRQEKGRPLPNGVLAVYRQVAVFTAKCAGWFTGIRVLFTQTRGKNRRREVEVNPASFAPAPDDFLQKFPTGTTDGSSAAKPPQAAQSGWTAPLAGLRFIPKEEAETFVLNVSARYEKPIGLYNFTDEEAYVNDIYLGRTASPGNGGSFLTVGLRNREALALGEAPLFVQNARGQVFTLCTLSGNLYLHFDSFSPPSFVVQSVLQDVGVEQIFRLVSTAGDPLQINDVRGRELLHVLPAKTKKTDEGYQLSEKGVLVIGDT